MRSLAGMQNIVASQRRPAKLCGPLIPKPCVIWISVFPRHGNCPFVRPLALGGAVFLIKQVMALPTGNERMLQIAGAIQEGAKAYLNRQIVTIGAIAAVIFLLLWVFRDFSTAAGFVLGAICSSALVTLECALLLSPMFARPKAPSEPQEGSSSRL